MIDKRDMLIKHEGRTSWLYLDSAGNVTGLVGHMFPTAQSAEAIAWRWLSDGKAARPSQIANNWERVKAMDKGYEAEHYRSANTIYAPPVVIEDDLTDIITDAEHDLAHIFPDYERYPEPAQAALLDMMVNLGMTRLTEEFPHFCAAVHARDWIEAAKQCHRKGISNERNDDTRKLLMEAGE